MLGSCRRVGRFVFVVVLACLLLGLSLADTARADGAEPASSAGPDAKPLPFKEGPLQLELGHDVRLALPAGYQFLGMPDAGRVLEKMGNLHNENLLGVVVSSSQEDEYFVTIRYDEEGFIKDDEKLDGKELLKTIQKGEEDYNEERKKAGFSPIHASGWFEDPNYDRAAHHVVWGLTVTASGGESMNYNTRILGRRGYVSVNLVTERAHLDHDKAAAASLLSATTFAPGATYGDFDSKKDKVAEYGLTGLVLGGLGFGLLKAAKIGLLAKFGKVIIAALIAGKKAIAALVVAAIAFLKRLFGKKSAATDNAPPAPTE
jgi:uncharacterized membrane-anchored protein